MQKITSVVFCILFLLLCASSPALGTESEEAAISKAPFSEENPAVPELYPEPEEPPATVEETVSQKQVSKTGQVSNLLETASHPAYIKGYQNGLFKPSAQVTRAEATQMFFGLLRQKGGEHVSFQDVENQWYAEAVETIAGLGIIKGYKDGTFRGDKAITRAEFVTIAVSFDTELEGKAPFSDVTQNHWAHNAIYTASEKGWINGYEDGSFRPDGKLTRAEAVAVLNRMLGRSADEEIMETGSPKNFYDMFPDHWAYNDVMEASTEHSFYYSGEDEHWGSYQADETQPEKSGWLYDGSTRYYLDAKTGKCLRGKQTIDGKTYLFSNSTGAGYTGFQMVGGWRRYYKNGLILDDISGEKVVTGPYLIKVYKTSNYLIIYAKDSSGKYNTPVRAVRVSCGYPTILGTYYTPAKFRWCPMIGGVYAQWVTQISGNYLFHSVPYWTLDNANLELDEFNRLGETRSLGCIRMNCRDAKWIYDNCALGTQVVITDRETSGPLSKPEGIKLPSWHTWDPTDPEAYWRCRQHGCH